MRGRRLRRPSGPIGSTRAVGSSTTRRRTRCILTPTQQTWAFKWYAQRAEYVSYKDCPQDGPGIVEWNNRLLYLADWTARHAETGFTVADMAPLRAGHFVHRRPGTRHVPLSAGLSQRHVSRLPDRRLASEVLTGTAQI